MKQTQLPTPTLLPEKAEVPAAATVSCSVELGLKRASLRLEESLKIN